MAAPGNITRLLPAPARHEGGFYRRIIE